MARWSRHEDSSPVQRVRDEVAEALGHLAAAATEGGSGIGRRTRRAGATARQRAALAAMALRGEQPALPIRWLAAGVVVGVAVGFVAGAVVGAVLSRSSRADSAGSGEVGVGEEPAPAIADVVREKARALAEVARDKTATARQAAARAARGKLARQPVSPVDSADSAGPAAGDGPPEREAGTQ